MELLANGMMNEICRCEKRCILGYIGMIRDCAFGWLFKRPINSVLRYWHRYNEVLCKRIAKFICCNVIRSNRSRFQRTTDAWWESRSDLQFLARNSNSFLNFPRYIRGTLPSITPHLLCYSFHQFFSFFFTKIHSISLFLFLILYYYFFEKKIVSFFYLMSCIINILYISNFISQNLFYSI